MARLSGYLSGQLANPSYGGMLSQNVQGGMQGIADTMAAKRQRNATDSMLTMLTNFDVNDPKVLDSVKAVGRQTGQDPLAVEKLIQDQQAQARIKQEVIDQQKRMKWAEASNAWQEKLRAQADAEQNASAAVLSAYNKNPSSAQAVLESLPAELQPAAMETLAGKQRYEQEIIGYQEEAMMRDGLGSETLESIKSIGPYGEQLVDMYEKTKGEGKRAAASRILQLYDQYMSSVGYVTSGRGRSKEGTLKEPTQADIKLAQEYLGQVDITPTERQLMSPSTWLGDSDRGIPPEYEGFIARDLAKVKKNDDSFVPTPEWVTKQVEMYVKGEANEPSEEDIKLLMNANPGKTREEIIQHLKDNP